MTSLIPDSLSNGGVIQRRQTTFWDVATADGKACWRVHFDGKKEFHFQNACFGVAAVFTEHALLQDYHAPNDALFISSAAMNAEVILNELTGLCDEWFQHWRSIDRYLNPYYPAARLLAEGSGMLLRGPRSFVEACEVLLKRATVRVDEPTRGRDRDELFQAMLLGRNFVVARGFRFEPQSTHSGAQGP